MYYAWLHYGEFVALGIWGILLTLVRRVLFGKLCKDAALGSDGKGKMLKQMTLKFEKSSELNVGIYDMPVFVRKYLCQERRFKIPLARWRHLPERWTSLILSIGFAEAVVLKFLGYNDSFCVERLLAAALAAAIVHIAVLWFESASLWERTEVLLMDYVANTLYPRQNHEYESFEPKPVAEVPKEPVREMHTEAEDDARESAEEVRKNPEPVVVESKRKPKPKSKAKKGVALEKEEEQIFQEVLSDFLGSST